MMGFLVKIGVVGIVLGLAGASEGAIRVGAAGPLGCTPVFVGPAYASGQAIDITTSQIEAAVLTQSGSAQTEWRLWIYDEASQNGGLPTLDVGVVTIIVDTSTLPSDVRIMVLPATNGGTSPQGCTGGFPDFAGFENPALVTTPDVFITNTGSRALYGLKIAPAIQGNPTSEALASQFRHATRALIAVTHDVGRDGQNDVVEIGQIHRLQAFGVRDLDTNTILAGGNVFANLTAVMDTHESHTIGLNDFDTIAFLAVGNQIKGTVQATGAGPTPLDPAFLNRIAEVRVGPATNAVGIQGDMLAPHGKIGNVWTSGPIGSATNVRTISAANGIREVRVVDTDSGVLVERDIHATIVANTDYTKTNDPPSDAAVKVVETGGNIYGTILAGNFVAVGGGTFVPGGAHVGIYARGDIFADITVDGMFEGNIVARRILPDASRGIHGDISIGYMLEGSIIAWAFGDPTNHVHSISIGYDTDPGSPYDLKLPTAFLGSSCGSPNLYNQTPVPDTDDDIDLMYVQNGCDEGAWWSIIAAESVGTLRVRQMTAFESPYEPYAHTPHLPSIEVPRIDNLEIGYLREGVVWSGLFDAGSTTRPPSNTNPTGNDDYASIGTAKIACMGVYSDLWIRDASLVEITGNVLGEIHVPRVHELGTIRIGKALTSPGAISDPIDLCGCVTVGYDCATVPYDGPTFEEDDPRYTTAAARGAVFVAESRGLRGQVVINAIALANPDPAFVWAGEVDVSLQGGGVARLAGPTISAQPDLAPYYNRSARALGADDDGGEAGLVPYRVHRTDFRYNPPLTGPRTDILQSELSPVRPSGGNTYPARRFVEIPFYGPVRTLLGAPEMPVSVEYQATGTTNWSVLTYKFFARVQRSQTGLETPVLSLGGIAVDHLPQMLPPGRYRVRPLIDGSPASPKLTCAGLLASIPMSSAPSVDYQLDNNGVAMFAGGDVEFTVLRDANADGEPDTGTFTGSGNCIADVDDGSGTGTPDEGVTIDDLLYYLAIFAQGIALADVDDGSGEGEHDGGVTIDDLLYYIYHYEAGC